ncbi:MAG TPA: MupA/Atu3671 family FMN-dependent luciferase-like monooxygenase [Candidatus Angelobacter sp.]|nr:MupA/Atu3671 family FMN-dependent luciferase-like monooxygenase [Candidatus Angelobacter sp.]
MPIANGIAVIGMSGRFPGAENLQQLWENLIKGVETISSFSDEQLARNKVSAGLRKNPAYVPARGVLKDVECFDAALFGMNRREAELTDPQHRVLLECAWEALEAAGYNSETYAGRIGFYAGTTWSTYFFENVLPTWAALGMSTTLPAIIGNDKDYLTTKVSYKLNLRGPSLNIQTACSTSLVCIHQACQSLLTGECDMALAGGVSIQLPQENGYMYLQGGISSSDGHCRPFDNRSDGTVFGNGVGLVLLKRLKDALEDRDVIHAVIRGSAISNDGCLKIGFTAPSVSGQCQAILDAIAQAEATAGVHAETIGYVEAHGSGTALGDPIEVTALTQAFRKSTSKSGFCALGSIKSNIGHMDAAAGVAGFIKAVLALKHGIIPPTLHFSKPNAQIHFPETPFYVNASPVEWKVNGHPRRAGVSAFGLGGTNAHVVVEQAPAIEPSVLGQSHYLLALSAKSERSLQWMVNDLAKHLRSHPSLHLSNVAYTLQAGRRQLPCRSAIVCADSPQAVAMLERRQPSDFHTSRSEEADRPLTFLFPGQGSQYAGLGRGMHENQPVFAKQMNECLDLLRSSTGMDLKPLLLSEALLPQDHATRTEIAQPALFIFEYSLAATWMKLGISPQTMLGHSVGEYVAACLAGVFSLPDALQLVAFRGQIMQKLPPGSMLAVRLSEQDCQKYCNQDVSIAAVNGPSACVFSGTTESIDRLKKELGAAGVYCKQLRTSHAFHSSMMDPAIEPMVTFLNSIPRKVPRIPFLSNLTGTWITNEQAQDPRYWGEHLREKVRFNRCLETLLGTANQVVVEVGPGTALTGFCRQHPAYQHGGAALFSSIATMDDQRQEYPSWLKAVAGLWSMGMNMKWEGAYDKPLQRVLLPTYRFDRQQYWIEPQVSPAAEPHMHDYRVRAETESSKAAKQDELRQVETMKLLGIGKSNINRRQGILQKLKLIAQELVGGDINLISADANFFELGIDSLLLIQAIQSIEKRLGVKLSVVQVLSEITTLNAVAAYIDEQLTAQAEELAELVHAPAQTVQQAPLEPVIGGVVTGGVGMEGLETFLQPDAACAVAPFPETAVFVGPNRPPATTPAESGLEAIVQQQLALMRQQLEMLGRNGCAQPTNAPATPMQEEHYAYSFSESSQKKKDQRDTRGFDTPDVPGMMNTGFRRAENGLASEVPKQFTREQEQYLDAFIRQYNARTASSRQIAEQSRSWLADSRRSAGFNPRWKNIVYPIIAERAAGAHMWDIDGNKYVDITMGFGVHLFGHAPKFLTEVLERRMATGIPLGPQLAVTGEAARMVAELTGLERVLFCNSGTDAVVAAVRAARTVTGKNKLVMFAGSYHGWSDMTYARRVRRQGLDYAVPAALGILPEAVKNLVILEYGNPDDLEYLASQLHDVAAVLVEPVQSRHPEVVPVDFLKKLRKLTQASGCAFILDEMITGFRVHPAGVQGLFGIKADMATYGKVIGGGMPVGVIAGIPRFMDAFDGGCWRFGDDSAPSAQKTYCVATYFKHPLSMAAVEAVGRHLREQGAALQERLNERTALLARELNERFSREVLPLKAVQFGSLFRLQYDFEQRVTDLFVYHLNHRGIFAWEGGNYFLSTAHTEEDIRAVSDAIVLSALDLRNGGLIEGRSLALKSGPQEKSTVVCSISSSPAMKTEAARNSHTSVPKRNENNSAGAKKVKAAEKRKRLLEFSLYFFGRYEKDYQSDKYDLLFKGTRFADENDFTAVWLPERHFHSFGGFSPNPSILAAALARSTERVSLRAGSVVMPLHNPIRVAEEWSVVDNLSGGRVGVSFASGWHVNDFALAPKCWDQRYELMRNGIHDVRTLWEGHPFRAVSGSGQEIQVQLFPRPAQRDLPFWLTGTNTNTYALAGELGGGMLTNLQEQPISEVKRKIEIYRKSLAEHGYDPSSGHVTVLLHTLIGENVDKTRATAREPFLAYLKSSLGLLRNMVQSEGRGVDFDKLSPEEMDFLLNRGYEQWITSRSLIGSVESCKEVVESLIDAGVNEIACFIDFGADLKTVIEGLPYITLLKELFKTESSDSKTHDLMEVI